MLNGNIISVDTPDNHSIFMDLFRNKLETMLNTLLLAELTEFLSYDKYDVSGYNTGNSRNGYYERSLHTIFSNITIKIPRDRLGQFQNKLLTPYNRNFGNLEEMIIQLYQKGITTREIADIIEKLYDCYYSPQTISNMTQVVAEEVDAPCKIQGSIHVFRLINNMCPGKWVHIISTVINIALYNK